MRLPVCVAGCAFQRRVKHLRHLGPGAQPAGQLAAHGVLRGVAHGHGRQAAQHQFRVVRGHAEAQPHVRELDALVQRVVARDDRAHQHVAAAAGVLGERLHDDVDAVLEAAQRQARAPGVVQGRGHALVARHTGQRGQVGEFHRHRARGLQPHQPRLRADQGFEGRHVHRVVQAVRDAEALELVARQLPARAVHVGRQQHLVARRQQRQIDHRHRRQAAGHQHALQPAFQRGDALLQQEGGGRPVQAVGVAVAAAPVACAQRRGVGEDHRAGLEDPRRGRLEASGRLVGVVDQFGDQRGRLGRVRHRVS